MKLVGLMLASISLLGCRAYSVPRTTAEDVSARITYFRDSRTGLCFAATPSYGMNLVSISNVPCSTEVNLLLKDGGK